MTWLAWVLIAVALILGLVGGALIGVWLVRKSMSNMKMDDQEVAQMARKMGMNLNPRQLQVVKQQMRKAGQNPPPLLGKKKDEGKKLAIPPKGKK